jgi:hAT family C-terminal dimerisation region
MVEEDDSFDVLKWWSQNCIKFSILSKLARDVLCILITIIASESAFSAGGRVLDDYRSSLIKYMVEIIVCGGDWIKATSKTTIQMLQVRFNFQIIHLYSKLATNPCCCLSDFCSNLHLRKKT